MYHEFFGLREQPFNLTPDPQFLYVNASYREALAALTYGIAERKGFMSLIGEAGTGKTTLLRCLLTELGTGVRSVLVLNPAIQFEQLLSFILSDLGRAPLPGTSKLRLLEELNAELLDSLARGENVVVLIDEAQDLGIQVLEELRLLSNLETAKEKILQLVLVGQPELDAMLARGEIRQLRQRISVAARLRPLARSEVSAYVAVRLRAAGGDGRALFTRPALHRVWQLSRGVPRVINVLCDNALVTAFAERRAVVGWRMIDGVARDIRMAAPTAAGALGWWRRGRLAPFLVAAVIGTLAGVVLAQLATGVWRRFAPERGATVAPKIMVAPSTRAESAPPEVPPEAEVASHGSRVTPERALRSATRVRVEAGETLGMILERRYGSVSPEMEAIVRLANPSLTDPNRLIAGQELVLPALDGEAPDA